MPRRFLGTLALLLFLALPWPSRVQAQEAGDVRGELSWEPGEVGPGPTSFVPPEERVAAMVREALHNPGEDRSWACLDQALSDMNVPKAMNPPAGSESETGQESHPSRKLPSDSLACAGGLPTPATASFEGKAGLPPHSPGAPVQGRLLEGLRQRVDGVIQLSRARLDQEPWVGPGILVLGALLLLLIGRRSALGSRRNRVDRMENDPARPGGRSRGHPGRTRRSDLPESPRTTALALLEGGLPVPEIARRTGLAQDALSVLRAVRTIRGAPGFGSVPGPSSGTAPDTRKVMERR